MRVLVALLALVLVASCGSTTRPSASEETPSSTTATTEELETPTTTAATLSQRGTTTTGVSSTTTAEVGIVPGLVAHYPMDGSVVSVADPSGAWDGVAFGITPAEDRFGGTDGAYLFSGDRGYIAVTPPFKEDSPEFGQAITIAAWIQVQAEPREQDRWFDVVSFQPGSHVLAVDGAGHPIVGEQGSYACAYIAEGDVLDGGWHHLAMTRDDLTVRAYLDGAAQMVVSQIEPAGSHDHGLCDRKIEWSPSIWIGGDSEYDEFFVGLIDDVRIFNRALAAEEVWELLDGNA